ncbi:hypothetical protein [Streptomyces bacillaris]|uniref:hypothetical protein n=1 Tax=Streptomyces bacillaris TaxID=68179 RepID=UPI0038287962
MPTGGDEYAEPGEEVGEAAALLHQAQEVLTRTVIFERAKGTSWATIAEQLGITEQTAQERYGEAEQAWKEALHEPFNPIPPGTRAVPTDFLRLHQAAYAPIAAGQSLDAWAQERGKGEHAVTGGLPALSLLDEMGQLLNGLSHLYRNMYQRPDPVARLRLTERKAGPARPDRHRGVPARSRCPGRGSPRPRRPAACRDRRHRVVPGRT